MPTGVYVRKLRPAWDRFWEKVDKNGPIPEYRPDLGPCWVWTAGKSYGYGSFAIGSPMRHVGAHLVAYKWLVGPVPQGRQIDHLCRNRACVNPTHLEPVQQVTNILRGESPPALNATKTHCVNGHPLSGPNLYVHPKTGYRSCVVCREVADARYAARRNKGGPAQRKIFAAVG